MIKDITFMHKIQYQNITKYYNSIPIMTHSNIISWYFSQREFQNILQCFNSLPRANTWEHFNQITRGELIISITIYLILQTWYFRNDISDMIFQTWYFRNDISDMIFQSDTIFKTVYFRNGISVAHIWYLLLVALLWLLFW